MAPARILAITFTERAAGELRERVRARLLELDERDVAREAEAAHVSTFHGFCARLLRVHPLQAGVDPFKPKGTENELKDEFPDRVTVAVIPNASHALLPEQPAAVVEAIAVSHRCRLIPPAKTQ